MISSPWTVALRSFSVNKGTPWSRSTPSGQWALHSFFTDASDEKSTTLSEVPVLLVSRKPAPFSTSCLATCSSLGSAMSDTFRSSGSPALKTRPSSTTANFRSNLSSPDNSLIRAAWAWATFTSVKKACSGFFVASSLSSGAVIKTGRPSGSARQKTGTTLKASSIWDWDMPSPVVVVALSASSALSWPLPKPHAPPLTKRRFLL
mmetsp:Transcript_13475/g.35847  ORF Transcript_13475/g.35847 Transcript_13475/m.35847 type:complete len:205 (-) Transcript_13475:249-863(-)